MKVTELREKAAEHGFQIRQCSDVHYQIVTDSGKQLVDVWPTTDKFRQFDGPQRQPARVGGAAKAISLAMSLVAPPALSAHEPQNNKPTEPAKALDKQVGGDHYKRFVIQPLEFIVANELDYVTGNVVKYVCRHHLKGGKADLEKAIHYLEVLKEARYGK